MQRPRILPPVYLAGAIGLMLLLHVLAPLSQMIVGAKRWEGLIFCAAGVLLGVWAARSFARHGTTIKPGEVSSQLVTNGPFRFSRNPIYIGMIVMLAGVAVLLGSLTPWAVIPLFFWTIRRNIVPVEEAMLTDAFGEKYRRYQKRVRRWV